MDSHPVWLILFDKRNSMLEKMSHWLGKLGQTLASIVKIMLLSRRATVKTLPSGCEIVVLGNGPSLNDTIANHSDFLDERMKMAVNFAANTPVFFQLRPEYYVLADPHFFSLGVNGNVDALWKVFRERVDWKMTLFVPVKFAALAERMLGSGSRVAVERYNTTPVEGFEGFCHTVYRSGLGMPRPRNVLIPSIMLALAAGFKTVYVAGADHSWMKTLSVDNENRVMSVQPHFYKDDNTETQRVNTEYMRYPLHQIVYSFYVAFKSYHVIRRYADRIGASVVNVTPGSFIDAFPRKML